MLAPPRSSPHHRAAVNVDRLAGDAPLASRARKTDIAATSSGATSRCCGLIPAERRAPGLAHTGTADHIRDRRIGHRRIHIAGADGIDGHAVVASSSATPFISPSTPCLEAVYAAV